MRPMSSTAIATTPSIDPLRGYMPVHVRMLQRIENAPVDLFVQVERGHAPTLYCRAGLPLENHQFLGLSEAGVRDVYVRTRDFEDFGSHLLESMEEKLTHQSVPPSEQFATLQLAVAAEVERTIQLVDCEKFVSLSHKLGREITACLAKNDVLPRDLFRMARHDFTTFAHVTNVAAYCVVLAEQMRIVDTQELEQIATAAMLHDLGKRHIPTNILTKPARLTPAERDLIETHPTRGYEELCCRSELTTGQLMMVYQHHEHIDGRGYPVGVLGHDIHPWAKMLAVVDVFDAMTGKRPYRRPASALEAMRFIELCAGTQLDEEVVRCWASAMNSG